MAPPRRQSNGRSPLVNQQSQITSFFTKKNSTSPSHSPSPPSLAKQTSKLNPNPKPNTSPSKSPSPTTPSPLESRLKKPILIIGQSPSTSPSSQTTKTFGNEVVDKRLRVYWPLDKAWYEGTVKSFDKDTGKHLILYDDAEEEELDLGKEKIEWVEDTTGRFKRLRRGGSLVFKKVVIEDEDEDVAENLNEKSDDNDDDSSDEDWGGNAENEVGEDADEEEMDLEDEKEEEEEEEELEEEVGKKMLKRKGGRKAESNKRKASGVGKLDSGKKSKTSANASGKEEFKVLLAEPEKKIGIEKASSAFDKALITDGIERFGKREAEKLYFLGPKVRRDANRKRPGDVNYNPKTLYLPPDFLKSLSGGQRQWWEFKSKHMDKVLFFKMATP